MPKARKLTLSAAAELARKGDPAAWDAMSPSQRREQVDQVNAHHATVRAADKALAKMFPKAIKR